MDTNSVKISGTIVQYYPSEKFIRLRLITAGTSGKKNFPTIMVFNDDDGGNPASAFGEKDRVTITGRIQTKKGYPGGTIVASEIIETPMAMSSEFNVSGVSYADDINRVNLAGEIVHIFHPNNNAAIVSLRTITEGHYAFPEVSLFGSLAAMTREFNVGDKVAILGTIQTKREQRPDGYRYHEDVVARDIALIEE